MMGIVYTFSGIGIMSTLVFAFWLFNQMVDTRPRYSIHDPQGVIGEHHGYTNYAKTLEQAERIAKNRASLPPDKRVWAFPVYIKETITIHRIDVA
jgi:hypothetical protein